MPIHNITKPAMTDLHDDLYITIKNDQALLEMFFQALFHITQVHLGRSKRKEMNGIIAHIYGYQEAKKDWVAKRIQEHLEAGSIVITPEGKVDGRQTVTLTVSTGFCSPILTGAVREYNKLSGENLSLYATSHDATPLIKALFEDYWDDMLAFGKKHTRYQRDWDTIGYALRTAA